MKTLSFGEILWDIYPEEKYIGGAPLNFAAHLSQHGENVSMMSAVGRDKLGEDALYRLSKWHISTKYVSLSDYPTGRCFVSIDNDGIPKYDLLENAAFDRIPYWDSDEDFDVLYFGTLALRSEHNHITLQKLLANKKFSEIFVDINIRPPFYSKKAIESAFSKASIIKISIEELPIVAKESEIDFSGDHKAFAQNVAKKYDNIKIIIITLGEKGAFALDCKKDTEYGCNAEKVEVASTVGAGDSFSAAFLHKYTGGSKIQHCLDYASRVSGFVVTRYDAVPEYSPKDFE